MDEPTQAHESHATSVVTRALSTAFTDLGQSHVAIGSDLSGAVIGDPQSGIESTVYPVRVGDMQLAVKIGRAGWASLKRFNTERDLIALVNRHCPETTPPIIWTGEIELDSRTVPVSIQEFARGVSGDLDTVLSVQDRAAMAASAMRAIERVPASGFGPVVDVTETAVVGASVTFEEFLDDRIANHPADEFFRHHLDSWSTTVLRHVWDEFHQAVPYLRSLNDEPGLFCHYDISDDNLFVDGDQLTLIDWGNSRVMPAGFDLARTGFFQPITPYLDAYRAAGRAIDTQRLKASMALVAFETLGWRACHAELSPRLPQYLALWARHRIHCGLDPISQ